MSASSKWPTVTSSSLPQQQKHCGYSMVWLRAAYLLLSHWCLVYRCESQDKCAPSAGAKLLCTLFVQLSMLPIEPGKAKCIALLMPQSSSSICLQFSEQEIPSLLLSAPSLVFSAMVWVVIDVPDWIAIETHTCICPLTSDDGKNWKDLGFERDHWVWFAYLSPAPSCCHPRESRSFMLHTYVCTRTHNSCISITKFTSHVNTLILIKMKLSTILEDYN